MPVNQKHCRVVFGRLSRELTKLARHSGPDTVHKLRTSVRRVETVVQVLIPKPDRSTRKLLKLLRQLRKKAGRVRDLDVQLTSLKNLKAAGKSDQKAQLSRTLTTERSKREKRLIAALDKEAVRELRKRLKRARRALEFAEGIEPLILALQGLSEISEDRSPLTQTKVHQYRIAGKRARYLIEIAGKDPKADAVAGNLKHMQDVVGDWHDWLTLTERAEEMFGGVKESALVAAMRNLTRAKFRESVDAIVRVRQLLSSESGRRSGKVPQRESKKPPQSVSAAA